MVIIIGKKVKKTNDEAWIKLRLMLIGICISLCFIIVVGHLVVLQFVQGKELSEKAYKQQVKNQILSPNRGTIYDSKGEILAQSISVDTVSLNPGKVRYANNKEVPDEDVAKGLSDILCIIAK